MTETPAPETALPDFGAGLASDAHRQLAHDKGWRDADSVVAAFDDISRRYDELDRTALRPPAADAPPEAWAAFHSRLGRPERADDYEFALPEGLPETLPYDGDSARRYKQWSHEAGLTPCQAQALHDAFLTDQARRIGEAQQAMLQRAHKAHADLSGAWGDPQTRAYAENLAWADRFINANGGQALLGELTEHGLVSPEGAVLSPVLAQAFARAGRALYAEDTLETGAPVPRTADPARTLYPNDPFAPRRHSVL